MFQWSQQLTVIMHRGAIILRIMQSAGQAVLYPIIVHPLGQNILQPYFVWTSSAIWLKNTIIICCFFVYMDHFKESTFMFWYSCESPILWSTPRGISNFEKQYLLSWSFRPYNQFMVQNILYLLDPCVPGVWSMCHRLESATPRKFPFLGGHVHQTTPINVNKLAKQSKGTTTTPPQG